MMKSINNRKSILLITGLVFVTVLVTLFGVRTYAEGKQYNPSAKLFENAAGFSMNSSDSVNSTSYGKQIGTFFVNGEVGHEATLNGTKAYAVDGTLTFGYNCTPADYQTKTKENWNLVSSDVKAVGDISLSKKVSNGVMIIQKSADGKTWENAREPIYNLFSDKKLDYNSLYSASEEEIKSGTYYRVIVAYEMKQKTGTQKNWIGFQEDVFAFKYSVEEYDFYLCYSNNPISVQDLTSRTVIANNATVTDGFMIDDHGANATITVKKDTTAPQNAVAFQTFTAPGSYTISVTSPIGDSFQNTVKVSRGLSTHGIPVDRYENPEKSGYTVDNKTSGGTSLTSVMIGQKAGTTVKTSGHNGFNGYGITGDSISLYIRLLSPNDYAKSGWEVISDNWGKKEKETIDGVWAGTVASGALIIQKSSDGSNWERIEDGRYANGLYTTDFYSNYAGNGDILIYSPDGKEVLKGVYIRVLYAYEIKQKDGKEKKRCIEECAFYLCNNELGAVTFHNITAKDQVKEICGDDNEIELAMYEASETMESGAVTVNGFKIDTSLNPTVTYTVKKNGTVVTPATKTDFTETGKYDIELKSAVGSIETVTLYVDRMTTDETLSLYFGNGFIDGKRIFSEGQYPTYEGGHTKYVLKSVSNDYQPLYGEITNTTTGKTTAIAASRTGKSVDLSEPGEYVVTLNNNPTYATEAPSGDNKVITFHFNLIAEGDAPGPKVNRQSLEDSVKESISGTYPKYYGLIYSSAAAGNITLAFKNREEAFQYAYNYEKGTVEEQKDGTYLYTGSFLVGQKERYDSNWDLTDALNYFADQAIHEMYFDVSDEATYLTLDDSVLNDTKNPRTLELRRSVIIFADGQEELLTDIEALPILNSRPFAYLTPGVNGNTKSGVADFEFIKDKYGCDSNSVEITDATGKTFKIEYDKDVDAQLAKDGCVTGKVTVVEKTVYGDKTSYDAVYFANGDNTAKITLTCYEGGQDKSVVISQADADKIYEADAFSIKSIADELDPYNLVIVKDENGVTSSYVADQLANGAWSDDGDYEVSVINRIGNKYSFTVRIKESEYATISFQGEGTGDFQPTIVKKGDKGISLPIPKRYGYEFAGYSDEQGTMYEDVIDQISFSGSKVLSPVWRSKKFNVVLKDHEGNEIDTISVDYGTETDIPAANAPDGYVFDGWLKDGVKLDNNKLKITEEKDIVLVASFVQGETVIDNVEANEGKNEKKKHTGFVVVMILALCGGAFALIKRKKKTISNKIDEPIRTDELCDDEKEIAVEKANVVDANNENESNGDGDGADEE